MTTPTKIVLNNGPAGSGKDAAADNIRRNTVKTQHMEFKKPLFALVKLVYNISDDEWDEMYTRENKEKPYDVLNGFTPRQALIHMSEDVIKPHFGQDFFGKWIVKDIKRYEGYGFRRFVFSDSGFPKEAIPLIEEYGFENVAVFRIMRDGYDYTGDSRSYLKPEDLPAGVLFQDVYNNGGLDEFLDDTLNSFKDFVGVCD